MSTVPSIFKKHSQLGAYTETARRTTYLNPLGRTNYAPGQECVFSLPNSNGWLDCENSYLEFDIQTTNPNLRRLLFDGFAGGNHVISQVVLYSPNGSIISEMQSYDLYSCIKSCQMSSSEFNSNMGANSAMSNLNNYLSAFDTSVLADTDVTVPSENQTISINLNCLFGRNNVTRVFPLHHLSGECRLHIFFNNTINSCGISVGVDDLSFNNMIYRMESILLPGEIERSFLSEPIKMYSESYAHQQSKITMGASSVSTGFTWSLRQPYSMAKWLIISHRLDIDTKNTNSLDSDLPTQFSCSLEKSGIMIPQRAFTSHTELFNEFKKLSGNACHNFYSSIIPDEVELVVDIATYKSTTSYKPRKVFVAFDLRNFSNTDDIDYVTNGTSLVGQELQFSATYTPGTKWSTKQVTIDSFLVYDTAISISQGMMNLMR